MHGRRASPRLSAITRAAAGTRLSVDDWPIMSGSPRARAGRPRVLQPRTRRRAPVVASRSAALGLAPPPSRSRTGFTIMPAPAVKLVAGSIRMKLPVAAILGISIEDERPGGGYRGRADLIQHQAVVDFGAHDARRLLGEVHASRVERPLVHPHDFCFEPLSDVYVAGRQHVAAADVRSRARARA